MSPSVELAKKYLLLSNTYKNLYVYNGVLISLSLILSVGYREINYGIVALIVTYLRGSDALLHVVLGCTLAKIASEFVLDK